VTTAARRKPVAFFDRETFLSSRWAYRAGEHVSFLGPTQSGKTTLAYQLLQRTTGPRLPGVALVMKPRDKTVTEWNRTLGYRRVRSWPPLPALYDKPPGYTLWPKHSFDFDRDNQMLAEEFHNAIRDCYKKGDRVLFADEVLGLVKELGLERDLTAVWTRGASMGCGLWAATQRPSHVPLHMYSQAHHLFASYDPDKRSRDRLAEIGGIDPELVKSTVLDLKRYQWLYIRRDGPKLCVIDK
jgi:hypothetical protein